MHSLTLFLFSHLDPFAVCFTDLPQHHKDQDVYVYRADYDPTEPRGIVRESV